VIPEASVSSALCARENARDLARRHPRGNVGAIAVRYRAKRARIGGVTAAVSAMAAPDRAHPDGVLWVRPRDPGACQPRRRVVREEGEFQIALLARDVPDATERRKARLREIARTSKAFGPILVGVTSLIELGESDIANGRRLGAQGAAQFH